MMRFDEIWPRFSWVIEEMRNGMCFFEGYVPSLGGSGLLDPLSKLMERADSHTFRMSTWSNETAASDWSRQYSVGEYVEFFESGGIHTLNFDYEVLASRTPLVLKLLFNRDRSGGQSEVALEIVCYRDTLLSSPEPKQAIADAIAEFRALKFLFCGDALFLGPDTLDRPRSATDFSPEWLRIE